jgi:hypothetical protein
MRLSTLCFSTTLAVLGAVTLGGAAQPSRSDIAQLQDAQDRVARFAGTTKGGAQQRLLLEKQRIQGLIDDLETGKPVDPADIDRTLQRSVNPLQ